MTSKTNVGIVLSGGGARGIAHLGAIKALLEMGIQPTIISGVSAGAWTGAFYGSGYNPEELEKFISKTRLFRLMNFTFSRVGLLRKSFLENILLRQLPVRTFEELRIKLVVGTTDFIQGKSVFYSEGPLIPPLVASASIPFLFQPVAMDNTLMVDGGLVNNFPVEPLTGLCDFIIGINVNPIDSQWVRRDWSSVIQRSMQIAIENTVHHRREQCDLFFEPPALSRYGLFDFQKAKEISAIGYDYVMAQRKDIEDIVMAA